ncbi:protein YgfX [Massilia sp. TS11]|uniref:protein YgfX n=1 Tax=Massilia sp. TS11 TaxID=2908003 RepID=UPI001EDA180F|nr:protein YgfX [Massilia sp. TS11]MCG2583382.1 hypothetical protein [Massilia sp. TS11]
MTVMTVVAPSRRLRALVLAFALLLLGAGLACALGVLGPLRWPWLAGGACFGASMALVGTVLPVGTPRVCTPHVCMPRQIELIAPGTLRLSVQPQDGAAQIWRLAPGTTVWPGLLLLALRNAQGGRLAVALMSDSLAPADFRVLARACLACATQKAGTYCDEPTL